MSILVSGIKPTGKVHIGSYAGAIEQFIALQEKYDTHIFVADMHALTTLHDRTQIEENTRDVVLDYLAAGLDPEKVTLFVQSSVPEVTELAWIFNCITTVPYLQRAHAYKDAVGKNKEVSVGTFDYPLLMAADILMYGAEVVPVGQDQKQHVEYARDTAEKFNRIFGETFTLPEPLILEDRGIVLGVDGRKMSKSYNNTIQLSASDEEIQKAVMSIPTDSTPIEEPKNTDGDVLYQLHSFFTPKEEFEKVAEGYKKGGMGYKESKEILIRSLQEFLAPIRERRAKFESDEGLVKDIITRGGERARERATATMEAVREKVGFNSI